MKVFVDFEASSLARQSFPIEVAWVFQDGRGESHLIAPAPTWTDWDDAAEAIHGIGRATLETEGEHHAKVAARMVEVLADHDIFASAPSWDGKWLSVLLRAAGLPRHRLRLRDTDEALRSTALEILRPHVPEPRLEAVAHDLVCRAGAAPDGTPAHRALADARVEQERWDRVRREARRLASTFAVAEDLIGNGRSVLELASASPMRAASRLDATPPFH